MKAEIHYIIHEPEGNEITGGGVAAIVRAFSSVVTISQSTRDMQAFGKFAGKVHREGIIVTNGESGFSEWISPNAIERITEVKAR